MRKDILHDRDSDGSSSTERAIKLEKLQECSQSKCTTIEETVEIARILLLVKTVAIELILRFKMERNHNLRVPTYFALNRSNSTGWYVYNGRLDLELPAATDNFKRAVIIKYKCKLRWHALITLTRRGSSERALPDRSTILSGGDACRNSLWLSAGSESDGW